MKTMLTCTLAGVIVLSGCENTNDEERELALYTIWIFEASISSFRTFPLDISCSLNSLYCCCCIDSWTSGDASALALTDNLTVDEWVDSKEAVTFVRTFNIRFPWHKMIAPESCEYRMFRSAFQKRHEINIPFTAKEREE